MQNYTYEYVVSRIALKSLGRLLGTTLAIVMPQLASVASEMWFVTEVLAGQNFT